MNSKRYLISSSIIGISIILGFTILGTFIYLGEDRNFSETQLKTEELTNENHNILSFEEAAVYLKISDEKLKSIIVIQKSIPNINVDYGLPYFKVDDEYYFLKSQLDLWLAKIAEQQINYDTEKYSISY
ncbi:hypothetical protein [Brassicibacter mesophilus]|jgi:hypothetical protein|uniref:hypothetical protein n=1 Tax=Brassicibacter mesophilus TaxID=745119 RepID=UPI003D21F7F6